MKSIDLVDIGPNDDLREVIRKCNYNFRRWSAESLSDSVSIVSTDENLDAVKQETAKAILQINNVINEFKVYVNESMKDIDDKIEELKDLIDRLEEDVDQSQGGQDAQISNLRTDIKNIIYGASIVNGRLQIPAGTKVPTGNINVFSNASKGGYIRTRAGEVDNDIWAKA